MNCDYGLSADLCPALPWCGHERNLPPSLLPDPLQMDIFDVLEDE